MELERPAAGSGYEGGSLNPRKSRLYVIAQVVLGPRSSNIIPVLR